MQTVLVLTGLLGFVGMFVLCAVRERLSILDSRWRRLTEILQCLCVVLWLGSSVLIVVFFPELIPSGPDPRH